MVLVVLFLVLDGLDAKEGEAQDERDHQAQHQRALLFHLGGPHAHGHGEAGSDEDGGVRGAPEDIELVRCLDERRIVPVAVDEVGGKEAAEEHDFGEQEEPHGEVGGVTLLRVGFEVMALVGEVLVMSPFGRAVHDYPVFRDDLAIRHWLPLSPSGLRATRSRMLRDP